MDSATLQATTPVAQDFSSAPAVSPEPTPVHPLSDQSPTGSPEALGTPESAPPEAQPQITYEQFQTLQNELAAAKADHRKDADMLASIKGLAEQQESERRQREFQSGLKTQLATQYQKASDANSSEEAVDIMFNFLNEQINGVTNTLQSQVDESWAEVEKTFWQATAPNFARDLIKENGLFEQDMTSLMQSPNQADMVNRATYLKNERQRLQQEFGQSAAAAQADRLRASGATAMSSESGGVPHQMPTSGTEKELRPIIAQILGIA